MIKKLFCLVVFTFTISIFSFSAKASIQTEIENTLPDTIIPLVFVDSIAPMIPIELINSFDFAPLTQNIVPPITPITNPIPILTPKVLSSGKPARLMIPSINVNANIEHIGLNAQGAVGVPEGAFDVSWFNAGPLPGQQGSAIISGHSGRWKDGTHSIFDPLPTLKIGETIYVKDNKGQTLSFIVKETRVYGKNDIVPEIFNKSDKAYLNIITCHGNWLPKENTYDKRYVVFAELQ